MKILLGTEDVGVSHIGGQPGQPRLDVDTSSVPLSQSVTGICVPQVVGPWASSARLWFEADSTQEAADRVRDMLDSHRLTVSIHEQRCRSI